MITYKVANCKHSVCQDKCPKYVHRLIKRFWKSRGLWRCSGAIVAHDNDGLVGFFRYNRETYWDSKGKRGIRLRAVGTYVLSTYRSRSVAKKLWARAIKQVKPKQIEVVITSRGGSKLVVALKKKYKKIDWRVIRNTY